MVHSSLWRKARRTIWVSGIIHCAVSTLTQPRQLAAVLFELWRDGTARRRHRTRDMDHRNYSSVQPSARLRARAGLKRNRTLRCHCDTTYRLGRRDLGLARRLYCARRITAPGCRPLAWWLFKLPMDGEVPEDSLPDANPPESVVEEGLTLGEALRGYRFWVLLLSIFLVYVVQSGLVPNLIPALTDAGIPMSEAATAMSSLVRGHRWPLAIGWLVDRFWAPAWPRLPSRYRSSHA